VPHKNPQSGRWAPPKYSLRRQAELIKHARASGTLHLLPPGPKMGQAQQQFLAVAKTTTPALAEEAVVVGSGLVSLRSRQEKEKETAEERETEGQDRDAVVDVRAADVADAAWTRPMEWVGTVRERNVAGADVGNRLYAGKKRMFKGHKWERMRERRVARTKMLLRDMDKRVERFKAVRFFKILDSRPLPPFLLGSTSLLMAAHLVSCQGQAVAAGEEVQRVEEDTEAAVLMPRLTFLPSQLSLRCHPLSSPHRAHEACSCM